MKKKIFLLILFFASFSYAQYFEGFEKGVPGTMTQTFNSGKTTWINFGMSAVFVDNALVGSNSAVFYDGMTTEDVMTSLSTPVLDLSSPTLRLEFKHIQKEMDGGQNLLYVELSTDLGKNWSTIAVYDKNIESIKTEEIKLAPFHPTKESIIRFRAVQPIKAKGLAIVIDDITISDEKNINRNEIETVSNNTLYPNPSDGNLRIQTSDLSDILIMDITGKVVFNIKNASSESTLDLTALDKGIYFAKIRTNDKEQTQKIILK